jgi:hypothetical protein
MEQDPKSLGELLKELGFRPDGNPKTAQAFIKNLERAAKESVGNISPITKQESAPTIFEPIQLNLFVDESSTTPTKKSS